MLVKVKSVANLGLESVGVEVEVNIALRGLPGFDIVGLPDKAVAESRERVKAAINSSNFEFPNKKIVVNLAPADLPKEGSVYDLPIALGIVAGLFGFEAPKDSLFFGELSLDGSLRHTKGALLLALFAKENGFKNIFVPFDSKTEAGCVKGVNVFPVLSLGQLARYFLEQETIRENRGGLRDFKGNGAKGDDAKGGGLRDFKGNGAKGDDAKGGGLRDFKGNGAKGDDAKGGGLSGAERGPTRDAKGGGLRDFKGNGAKGDDAKGGGLSGAERGGVLKGFKGGLRSFKGGLGFRRLGKVESPLAEFDMAEILGQEQSKRAMEIAASGGHNIMLSGSPGAGKTMLARALPGVLPQLSDQESLEVTKIYSAAGQIPAGASLIFKPPFRTPHHTSSSAGLIGGGQRPQPGEISLAHRGVLFMDEFNEFPRYVLEALRQPIEEGFLVISRSKGKVRYPARFMLVASCNPCPCGYLNHPKKQCQCSLRHIQRYRKKVSGPILDRIDLHQEVPPVDARELGQDQKASNMAESSESIRQRVVFARKLQYERFIKEPIFTNAEMKNRDIKKYCFLDKEGEKILQQAALKFQLSARGYLKVIKVARTIADLAGLENIQANHIAEALQYRFKEYEY